MLIRLLGWFVVGCLWATGCAGVPSSSGSDEAEEREYSASAKPLGDIADSIYLVLTAEIAGQRGHYEEALDNYLEVSKRSHDPKVAERATQIALFTKSSEKSLAAVNLWIKQSPNNLAAHRILLMLMMRDGKPQEASAAFDDLVRIKDPELENTMIEIVKWFDLEVPRDQGLEAFKNLSASHPKAPEVHLAYAMLAMSKGALDVAVNETNKSLALKPSWPRAEMVRAQIVAQGGDADSAKTSIERALKINPKDDHLRLVYAQLLAKTRNFKGAEKELDRIVRKDANNREAQFALASVWMELGEFDRARNSFLALSDDPRYQIQANYSLGIIDGRQGLFESALERFDSIPKGPLQFEANLNSVSTLMNLGRFAEVGERLDAMRQAYPAEALRLYMLEAETYARRGETQRAFEILSRALDAMPTQPELLYSRALIAEQLGKLDVLESDLRKLLDQKPDDPAALNALGFSLADHGSDRLDEAMGYIKKALDQKPNDAAILDSYGWVLYRKGDLAESQTYLKKAFSNFRDPEIAAHLGEVLWINGQKGEARKVWSEGMKLNPDQDDMKRVREKYPEAFATGGR